MAVIDGRQALEEREPRGAVAPRRDAVERELRLVARGRSRRRASPSGASTRGQVRRRASAASSAPVVVRRVDEDEVVALPALASARSADARPRSSTTRAGQPQLLEVRADRRGTRRGRDSTNDAARGAARERLEPQRARAREEVEHGGAVDRARADQKRPRGRGRPSGASCARPFGAAIRRAPCAQTPRRSLDESARGRSAVADAARLDGSRRARLVVDAALATSRRAPRSSRSRSLRAAARSGGPEARLARAEELALAAQLEVDARRARSRRSSSTIASSRSRARLGQLLLRAARRAGSTTARAPRPTRPRSWWSCARPKRSASWTIMIVAFGTSTPTSITVVATSTSSSPRLERAPSRSRRSAGFSRPCSSPTRKPRSSRAPQPLGLRLGRARAATSRTPRPAGRRRRPAGPSSRCARSRVVRLARCARSVDPRA